MDNFNYKKYLAEGKLLNEVELTDDLVQKVAQAVADEFTAEDNELDLKYIITPNSIEADPRGGGFDLDVEAGPNTPGDDWEDSRGFGIANYLGDYAGGSFVIRPEGDGYLVTNAASRNAKVAYITPEGEIEIISAEDSKADLGMTDDVETDYMERRKEMSDYMEEIKEEEIKKTKSNKMKKETVDSKLAEIEKQSQVVALEAKIAAIDEMIESKNQRIAMVTEDDNLSQLVDKKKMKEMQREVKDLERRKAKMEKLYEKMCGKSYTKEEIVDEEMPTELNENKTKMKKSELKEMIKAAMMAEAEITINDTTDAYDPVAEIEDMDEGDDMYEAEEVDVEDNEKVDVDIEKDVEVDDESVETDIDVKGSMPGEGEDEIAVQSLLMKAQEEAEKLGDEKLTDQIGNTITYFTRAHVSKVDNNESINESTVRRGNDGLINKLL